MRQYSMKLGGSQKERRKFLKRNARPRRTVDGEEIDINDPKQVQNMLEASASAAASPATSEKEQTKSKSKSRKKDPAIDKIVEEAVDATL